jgi:hypothetical protein
MTECRCQLTIHCHFVDYEVSKEVPTCTFVAGSIMTAYEAERRAKVELFAEALRRLRTAAGEPSYRALCTKAHHSCPGSERTGRFGHVQRDGVRVGDHR